MRKDLCYFYPVNIEAVYAAYQSAISQQFKKTAEGTPYHTLIFGLSYSFKYNMNGGGCHVHLMQYNGGTAVDLRYTIAQAMGARYKAHASDLNGCVERLLGVPAQSIEMSIEAFMNTKHQQPFSPQPMPQSVPQPVAAPAQPVFTAPTAQGFVANFCPKCGTAFAPEAQFCHKCGTKRI